MAKANRKTSKAKRKTCPPCTMLVVAGRAASHAKTCDDKQRAAESFRRVAAPTIASRFVSKAKKQDIFNQALRYEKRASACGGTPAPVATVRAVEETQSWAQRQAGAAVAKALAREAASHEREPLVSQAMDGLYGYRSRGRRRRR